MKNPYYVAGFLCAIVLVCGICALLFRKAKKEKAGKQFDEMQLLARQKAAVHGFTVLMILTILAGLASEYGLLGGFDAAVIAVFAAVSVFGCECVFRNAYFEAGEENKSWMLGLAFLTVLNAVCVIRHVMEGTFMESILNLCCAVGMGLLLAAVFIQRGRNKRELEDE